MSASATLPLSRRSIFLVFAVAAVLAGVVLTALGLYRLFILENDAQSIPSLASQHRTDPGGVFDRSFGPALAPTPAPPERLAALPAAPPLAEASYRMIIDTIGVNAGVFTYGLDADRVPEVPLNGYDVAWYNFSADPGTGSNAVFAGHVTWGGEAVFYKLDDVQVGDLVRLRGDNGTELVYSVSDTFLVDPNDPSSLAVMSPTDDDVITLITCGGTFYYTGDPVFNGDYTHRRIVRATFVGGGQPAPVAGG
ncbi:MAG TPA: class F sortase [Dehalococcoidia bacterium]|jgi:LPXTG-site transpeptidase (sortase) family protein|nr:class F sortase [Dehalococcoidia bacterium]